MTTTKQLSIRLSTSLHTWLSNHVASIKPQTTINAYINYLIEQDREQLKLVDSKVEYRVNDEK